MWFQAKHRLVAFRNFRLSVTTNLVVSTLFVSIVYAGATPPRVGNNSHYIEGTSNYIWMPVPNRAPVMIDLSTRASHDPALLKKGDLNKYWLYTRKNVNTHQVIKYGDKSTIEESHYETRDPLIVIVHRWMSDGHEDKIKLITSAVLGVMEANVVVVDWSQAAQTEYITAFQSVTSIGRSLGSFINWIMTNTNNDWNNVHLIGINLGAHIVGQAGRFTGSRAARITGLDPTGPFWTNNSKALSAQDGQYVEIIHTDPFVLGLGDPIGTADFYPNGGESLQPGCNVSPCSHSRAVDLFTATVKYDSLVGKRCSDLKHARQNIKKCKGESLNMGNIMTDKRGRGIYQLTTKSEWPFY